MCCCVRLCLWLCVCIVSGNCMYFVAHIFSTTFNAAYAKSQRIRYNNSYEQHTYELLLVCNMQLMHIATKNRFINVSNPLIAFANPIVSV